MLEAGEGRLLLILSAGEGLLFPLRQFGEGLHALERFLLGLYPVRTRSRSVSHEVRNRRFPQMALLPSCPTTMRDFLLMMTLWLR